MFLEYPRILSILVQVQFLADPLILSILVQNHPSNPFHHGQGQKQAYSNTPILYLASSGAILSLMVLEYPRILSILVQVQFLVPPLILPILVQNHPSNPFSSLSRPETSVKQYANPVSGQFRRHITDYDHGISSNPFYLGSDPVLGPSSNPFHPGSNHSFLPKTFPLSVTFLLFY